MHIAVTAVCPVWFWHARVRCKVKPHVTLYRPGALLRWPRYSWAGRPESVLITWLWPQGGSGRSTIAGKLVEGWVLLQLQPVIVGIYKWPDLCLAQKCITQIFSDPQY